MIDIVRHHILLLILFAIPELLHGQQVNFRTLTVDEGLTSGNVRAIIQDYQGFVWIGTEDGLQRYDGYSFINYQHDQSDSMSLSNNFILCLFEDSFKNLWIGTLDGGLCLYDRKRNNFQRFTHAPGDSSSLGGNTVRAIYEASDGNIYIGTQSLSYFKRKDSLPLDLRFTNFSLPENVENRPVAWITSIAEDSDNNILLGLNGGELKVFDLALSTFSSYKTEIIDNRIQSLLFDTRGRLWIGSWEDGIEIYDPETGNSIHHKAGAGKGDLRHDHIAVIKEDPEGNVWIATDKGLSVLHHDKNAFARGNFVTYQHEENSANSLLTNSIKALYFDSRQRLWAGSYFGGINIYDKDAARFKLVRSKTLHPNSLIHNNVTAFAGDKMGRLWVGTDGGGLCYLPNGASDILKNNFISVVLKDPENGQVEDKVKSLETDNEGNLWVGMWSGGVFMINPVNLLVKNLKTLANNYPDLLSSDIMCIKADRLNNLWIGTFRDGVAYYNRETRTIKPFRDTKSAIDKIKTLYLDKQNRLWVGKESGGLHFFNERDSSFSAIIAGDILNETSTVFSIYEDEDGFFWIGVLSIGLVRYNPADNSCKVFGKDEGLPNHVIHAICEDENDRLWLSTNKGVSTFDPVTEIFTNYGKSDGLQGNQFNTGSSYLTSDGMILFGGTNGFNAFYPHEVETTTFHPPVVFTKFWLSNVEKNVESQDSPLEENIVTAKEIKLSHFQNSFSIEFSSMDFGADGRNLYAYFLEGFDKDWQYLDTDRRATFTNMNPGKYILRVKATNRDGVWSEKPEPLLIYIEPAVWQTNAFKAVTAILLIALMFLFYRLRMKYLIRQKVKLAKLVRLRTQELQLKNNDLGVKVEKIRHQNEELHLQKLEIDKMNNEIQAQNEELTAQNEQINQQREELEATQYKLREINEYLENLVDERTRKLKATIRKLDKTVLELDRFVYSASHDLSAPLKSILGLVKIAQVESSPEKIRECHRYIEDSILKLGNVIQSLVEFSRNTHLEIKKQPVNLSDLVDEIFKELFFWPEATKVDLQNMIGKDVVVNSDLQRLKIILHNLIGNSIKYADYDKEHPVVKVSCDVKEHTCSIFVEDNGIGIDDFNLKKVFNMYFRATERSVGSGLGLFIVKETVHKLKGKIGIRSEKGKGTVFRIRLKNS